MIDIYYFLTIHLTLALSINLTVYGKYRIQLKQ